MDNIFLENYDDISESSSNKKISFKNFEQISRDKYLKKINQNIAQNSVKLPQLDYVEINQYFKMDRKERNKFSAKKSRDRKKMYIKILEEKQNTLQKQLKDKQKQLDETQGYLKRISNQNRMVNVLNNQMGEFTTIRHQLIKKLEKVTQQSYKQNNQSNVTMNTIFDKLRSNIGATGIQRISLIDEYFKYVIDLFLPALHRYMMWTATEGIHLFQSNDYTQNDNWFKQLKDDLQLTPEQIILIKSKQKQLYEQKNLLEKLTNQMKNVKGQMYGQSLQLQRTIDAIRQILTPIQSAHFILFIQRNKYRKELNLCQKYNEQEFPMRKMIKKDI